ncbi:358_t:CDS:2 [Funneliformis geosporum]|nr:358_t:CDS:2 [Funneliformis geosporum]
MGVDDILDLLQKESKTYNNNEQEEFAVWEVLNSSLLQLRRELWKDGKIVFVVKKICNIYISCKNMSGSTFSSTTTSFHSFPSAPLLYYRFNSSSTQTSQTSPLNLLVDPQQSRCFFTVIPSEIFVEICRFLTPWDLDAISLVCSKFHEYLTCPTSSTTMNIWRTSRKSTIFFPQLPLPEGMNERDYCLVSMLERGCQFCNEKFDNIRIYWIFRVRSCWNCIMVRTIRISQRQSVPNFTAGLPYATFREEGMFGYQCKAFWKSDFRFAEIELSKIKKSERMNWIEEKRAKCEHLLTDALEREKAEKDSRKLHNHAKSDKIKNFSCKLMRNACYSFNKLRLCPTFAETIALPNHLFVKFTFTNWKDKIIKEYHEEEKKDSIRFKYHQIDKRLLDMLGPLINWKEHCATYKSPPYIDQDPRNPWSEEFIEFVIIPKIVKEAILCEEKAKFAKAALQLVENLIFKKVVDKYLDAKYAR